MGEAKNKLQFKLTMKVIFTITMFIYLIFFSFLAMSAAGMAADAGEEVDQLGLAALLIKNQNYSRASSVLAEIKDPHEVIPERYYVLKGIVELKQKRFKEALENLLLARKEGLDSDELSMSLAQAYLGLKAFKKGLRELSSREKALVSNPFYYQLMTSLHFGASAPEKAWNYLNLGMTKFPKHLPLIKQKWFYLMDNGLYEVSFEVAKELIDQYPLSALDTARMGQMYRRAKETDKAILLGEVARLKDPKDEEIVKDLARSYLKRENFMASAQLFADLSYFHPKYLVEASELWRKAGHSMHAQNLAIEIRDPIKKMKQNLTLALLNEDFNKMVSLGVMVERSELKSDQDIQYALAYAHFMIGSFKGASAILSKIERPDLFKKAIALREAMTQCLEEGAICI